MDLTLTNPSMIVMNTPAMDLALTNLAYCSHAHLHGFAAYFSHADLHGFAVPGTKLYLAFIADSFVLRQFLCSFWILF
nr:vesicle-fusing atpase [Quercus suber]